MYIENRMCKIYNLEITQWLRSAAGNFAITLNLSFVSLFTLVEYLSVTNFQSFFNPFVIYKKLIKILIGFIY